MSQFSQPLSHHDNRPASLAIPELENHWVAWDYVQRSGKVTKVPKNPRSGGNATSRIPSTWGSYEQAVKCAEQNNFAGVGIELGDFHNIGVDFDWKDKEGKGIPLCVQTIMDSMPDTYTEISPSGKGIRMFARGRLPSKALTWRQIALEDGVGMEVYEWGRFLTVTGWTINPAPLANLTDFFETFKLIRKLVTFRQPRTEFAADKNASNLDKQIALMRSAGEGFRNTTLNTVAYTLGGYVGNGTVDENEAINALTDAALSVGLGQHEIDQVVSRSIGDGKLKPFPVRQPRATPSFSNIEDWFEAGRRVDIDKAFENFSNALSGSGRTNVAYQRLVGDIVRFAQDPSRVVRSDKGMLVRVGGIKGLARHLGRENNPAIVRAQLAHLSTLGFIRGMSAIGEGLESGILLPFEFWESRFFRESLQLALPLSAKTKIANKAVTGDKPPRNYPVRTYPDRDSSYGVVSPSLELSVLRRTAGLVNLLTAAPRSIEELRRLSPFSEATLQRHIADLESLRLVIFEGEKFVQTKNLRLEFAAVRGAHEPTRRAELRSLESQRSYLSYPWMHKNESVRLRSLKSVKSRLERIQSGESLLSVYPVPTCLTRNYA